MIKKTVCGLLMLLALQGCNEEPKINNDIIYVKYADSAFQNPVDSFCVSNTDTMYSNKPFALDGYFKVYRWERTGVEQGLFDQYKMVGKWLYYTLNSDSIFQLYKSENYNELGYLHGDFITYYDGGVDVEEHYQFKNGSQSGIQKQFYPSGELFYEYETDSLGNYINSYVVFKQNKDTIYYQNFGTDGTGCAKKFDFEGCLVWERNIVNKAIEGWEIEYAPLQNQQSAARHKVLYHNNEMLCWTEFFDKEECLLQDADPEIYVDSIVREYTSTKIITKYYGKGGKILRRKEKLQE